MLVRAMPSFVQCCARWFRVPWSTPAVAIALLLLGMLPPGVGWAQDRVALVIGNSAYRHVPTLRNPGNDASDLAASLGRLGFAVRKLDNVGFDEMRRALLDFGRRARGVEMAVVFFAGHGVEVGGDNWLIPADAELNTDADVEHEAVALKNVMGTVEGASRLGLVILDACRNNPFAAKMRRTTRTRNVARGLVGVEPTGNVLVAYAAKDGTVAADGSGRNSPFTSALLRHIESPGLEINFLFRNVRDDVLSATNREQQPFVYGSLSREAIFLKAGPALPSSTAQPSGGPPADEVAWQLLRDTRDVAQLQRFIDQFPSSARRRDATERMAALAEDARKQKTASAAPQAAPPDALAPPVALPMGQPKHLGSFGNWGAYLGERDGRKICFALAKPTSSQVVPRGRPRDAVYLFISTRPAENVRNEVSIVFGYAFGPTSTATVEIGADTFDMYTRSDGAWIRNTTEESRMVETMRKGTSLVVKGVSAAGLQSTDSYALRGLAPALDRAAQECR